VKTRSRFTFVVLAMAMAMLLSSCWQIARIGVTDWTLSIDEDTKTRIRLDLIKGNPELTGDAYGVVVVGWEGTQLRSGGRQFDPLGNFGGPFTGVKDTNLRTQILAGAGCAVGGTTVADISGDFSMWQVWRTPSQIDFSSITQDDALRFKQFFRPAAGAIAGLPTGFIIITGSWADDGDGVVEAFELYCQSTYAGSLYVAE
jgi:hypothetical protein